MSLMSRLVYLLYILVAVISRITMLEYFLTILGEGYFLCIYGIIMGHLALIFILYVYLNWNIVDEKNAFFKAKTFIIRAFSSMYVHFPVTEDASQKEEDLR